MDLYFVRHAEAVDCAPSDEERALTEKGEAQARKVGRFCKENGIQPSIIVTSPYLRARTTAEIIAKELGSVEVVRDMFLASGMRPESAYKELQTYTDFESVMLVGHEPDFSMLISSLIGSASDEAVKVRKASLTGLKAGALKSGGVMLQFSIPVKWM